MQHTYGTSFSIEMLGSTSTPRKHTEVTYISNTMAFLVLFKMFKIKLNIYMWKVI